MRAEPYIRSEDVAGLESVVVEFECLGWRGGAGGPNGNYEIPRVEL